MIRGILLSVLLLCLPAWAQAATYYINDAGANANSGTSTGAPWLTWAHAFSKSVCGDTLVVMDGTYTPSVNGNPVLTKVCTAGTVYTVRALNQRVALIAGTGAAASFKVFSSAYIVLDGLRVKSADLAEGSGGTAVYPVEIFSSNHITFKNGLVYANNRYFNTHVLGLHNTTKSLIEDTELYQFHRHGVILFNSDFNVIRRLYCHSRAYADIAGGYPSLTTYQGESCVAIYPGSDNILENVIAEKTLALTEINASALTQRNQVLGSITYQTNRGIYIEARGSTATLTPTDTVIRNFVSIGSDNQSGITSASALNTQVFNSTVINAHEYGFYAFKEAVYPGAGTYSFFCTNCLATLNDIAGFRVTSDIQTWTNNYPGSFRNVDNYNPNATGTKITHEISEATDPALGSCYLWLPDASPYKRAGLAGADIGATILYRYKNGVLTNVQLWNLTTGEFPHGALVAGVNDVAGKSLFDVHKRLNVNTNGCSFPANYGVGGTDVEAPSTPANLSVF